LDAHEVDPVVEPILDWEPPLPLTARPAPAAFPLKVLPAWGREWVEAISTEKHASPDIAANLFVAVGGGAIARNVVVSPWPGYYEPTNVYVITALPPGQRKSPIFKLAFRPVRTLERARVAAWKEARKLAELARAMHDKRRKTLLTEAAEDEGAVDIEALGQRIDLELAGLGETVTPPLPRLTTEDVTPEKLAVLLGDAGRIIAASDEGSAFFDNLAGRYSGSTSWDVFNKAHSAGDLIVDRKGSDTVITYDPALTLAIATQPKTLTDLWGKPGVEGRGVLARPLYSLPAVVYSAGKAPPAPKEVLDEYERRIRTLYEDTPELAYDEDGHPRPTELRFDPEAESLFEQWDLEVADEVRARAQRDDDDSAYLGWLSKLTGQTARLAAIIHVTTHWSAGAGPTSSTITADTVSNAIILARYYRSNALAVFGLMGELPHQRLGLRLLDWIEREGATRFTTRDAHRPVNSRSCTVARVRAALRLLEEHGYIRPAAVEPGRLGRRPETWVTNPLIRNSPESTDNTDRTRSSTAAEPSSVSSVSGHTGAAQSRGSEDGPDAGPGTDPPLPTAGISTADHRSTRPQRAEALTLEQALLDPTFLRTIELDDIDVRLEHAADARPAGVLLQRDAAGPHAIELWERPAELPLRPAATASPPRGEPIGACIRCGAGVGNQEWTFGAWDGTTWRFSGHTLPDAKRLAARRPLLCCGCALRVKHRLASPPTPHRPASAGRCP
jgi:hypothetical protein